MLILILLLIHKGAAELEAQMCLIILLIQHGLDLSHIAIINSDNVKRFFHVVKVLDDDLRSA